MKRLGMPLGMRFGVLLGLLVGQAALAMPALAQTRISGKSLSLDGQRLVIEESVEISNAKEGIELSASRLDGLKDQTTGELNHLRLSGEVTLLKERGILLAEEMSFERSLEEFGAKGQVFLTDGEIFLWAEEASYLNRAEKVKFFSKSPRLVRMLSLQQESLPRKNLSKMEAWAEEILYDQRELRAKLQGQVRVFDEIREAELTAERAEIFFDREKNPLEMIATGAVLVRQPGRTARAERAHFDYRTKQITLYEGARVQDDQGRGLSSEKIEMHLEVKDGLVRSGEGEPLKLEIPLDRL